MFTFNRTPQTQQPLCMLLSVLVELMLNLFHCERLVVETIF